jgi:hypothetical protein
LDFTAYYLLIYTLERWLLKDEKRGTRQKNNPLEIIGLSWNGWEKDVKFLKKFVSLLGNL